MATSAGRRPSFSASSMQQALLAREASRGGRGRCSSPASSLSRCASRSASRRLLTKTIVRAVRADQLEDARVDLRPDAELRASGAAAEPPGCCSSGSTSPIAAMSSTGTTTCRSSVLRTPASTIVTGRGGAGRRRRARASASRPPRKPATTLQRPLRRRQPDALRRPVGQRLQALQRQRQVGAALGAGQGVDLVDDDPLDAAQRLPRLRGQQQVERLGRRDQDVRRALAEGAPLVGRRVAGAHRRRAPRACCVAPVACAPSAMPASGERRLRSTSWTSALSGETYSTRRRRSGSSGSGSAISRSRHHRNAASVLPDPVGAQMSVCSPAAMAGQPCAWAAVGAAKDAPNQSRVAGCEAASGAMSGAARRPVAARGGVTGSASIG